MVERAVLPEVAVFRQQAKTSRGTGHMYLEMIAMLTG
jgi:hypothetical protein